MAATRRNFQLQAWDIDDDAVDDTAFDGGDTDVEYVEVDRRQSEDWDDPTSASHSSSPCHSFAVDRTSLNVSAAVMNYAAVDVIGNLNRTSCSDVGGNLSGSMGPWSPQLTSSVDASPNVAVDYEYEIPRFDEMSLVKTVVLLVMFVVALAGNTATLVRMFHMRRRRSTINLLITHLATADLIVTFFCNVTDAVWTSTVQWYAGNAVCKILKYLQVIDVVPCKGLL